MRLPVAILTVNNGVSGAENRIRGGITTIAKQRACVLSKKLIRTCDSYLMIYDLQTTGISVVRPFSDSSPEIIRRWSGGGPAVVQRWSGVGWVGAEEHIPKTRGPNSEEDDPNSLERDPTKRKQLSSYPVNQREQVRLAYLNLGPFQIELKKYPSNGPDKRPRRFQYSWFNIFPNWLEYSPTTHAAYCFLCYVFSDKPNVRHGSDAFTAKGFTNWKKANDGKNCAFLKHLGSSQHKGAMVFAENLLNQKAHIENITEKQSDEQILKNRRRLKASIDRVRWLTFQDCAFRGHDETTNSKNRGN
ncbi:hypothetical protein LXL04_015469 [Taraxacum kok-saghyz]